jgi:hypothetical protein
MSAEVTKEDNIPAGFAARQEKLLMVGRPVEIEDQAPRKPGQLFCFSPLERLLPQVRSAVLGQKVLQAPAARGPANPFMQSLSSKK